jgi:quercetin dioxygenase-like cupin family protein
VEPLVFPAQQAAQNPTERGEGSFIQVLLGPDQGAGRFATRKFTILPGGSIPAHFHPELEHEQYFLSGQITLGLGASTRLVQAGDVVLIPPGTVHWYQNPGPEPAEFLCIIPLGIDPATEWL